MVEFHAAVAAYERNHWLNAHRALSALATGGHPVAAPIADQMWRHGPKLYGHALTAST